MTNLLNTGASQLDTERERLMDAPTTPTKTNLLNVELKENEVGQADIEREKAVDDLITSSKRPVRANIIAHK